MNLYIHRIAVVIFLAFFALPALVYIDPNAGGYIFQLLAPLVAVAMSVWSGHNNYPPRLE